MRITGVPLVLVVVLAAGGAVTGTVLGWHRGGRWRLPIRAGGVLLCEALVVLSAGLIVNRQQDFYPTWQSLTGDTGPAAAVTVRRAGDLDAVFGPGTLGADWQPPGSAGWRLRSVPRITVPAAYPDDRRSYPVLVALGARPARSDLVEVGAQPSADTTAGALADLPGRLSADLRVTGHGWALVAGPPSARLAAGLAGQDPSRFTALALTGVPPAGFRCPPPGVAVAVAARPGVPLPCQATRLTAPGQATGWAVAQTALPLAPPQVLPTAVRP
jgi:hypothetical protein